MAKLIGTAGHVDHGKTTLIHALTGIDADRLPEEKQRGMTIDVGFAYIDLPGVGRVSIVDVPGHERFLHNMLVGALGIDVALLCVAADDGVMPQTREHLQILDLLPVDRMIVALTRADLADPDTRAIATEEVRELLAPTRFRDAAILPVSAITGEGLDTLKESLASALNQPDAPAAGPWYLPIDRVFSIKGYGTVVTGTLAQGKVTEGERAVLMPGNVETRIRGIQWHEQSQGESEKGRRTALNLGGVRTEDLRRGMAVGAPGALFETRLLDARLRWVSPPRHGLRVRVSVGADEVIGKLFLSDHDPDLAQLRLERPVAVALGQPLVVRRYSPPDLIGGGRVAVPQAKLRRKGEAPLIAQAEDDDTAILTLVGKAPLGLPNEELCRAMGRTAQSLGDPLERLKSNGELLGFAGLWFTPERFDEAVGRLHQALERLHQAAPTRATLPRDRALAEAGITWQGKPLERIMATLVAQGRLRQSGHEIAHPEHRVQLNARQRELLDRVKAAMDAAGVNSPSERDLAPLVHAPLPAVEEILKVGIQAGEIVRIAEGIHYTREELDRLKERVREVAEGKPFAAAAMRDALGTTRKYIIPLLEYFDSIRFTARLGDLRVIEG